MGSPFGLEGTITSGIVSALHREMTAPNNFTITDTIETDSAINDGNSGGPLLDTAQARDRRRRTDRDESGDPTALASRSRRTWFARSFASPIATGKVEHGFLGVRMDSGSGRRRDHARAREHACESAGLRAATATKLVDGQQFLRAATPSSRSRREPYVGRRAPKRRRRASPRPEGLDHDPS